MWFRKFPLAALLVVVSLGLPVGFAGDAWVSDSPGLLHQLLTTGGPAWAVEQALEWGADPDAESVVLPGRNALHLAAEFGTVEHLVVVAPRVRDLNAVAGMGGTALTLAVEHGDWLDRLRVLLEAGADPNVVDGRGDHPLALVASKGGAAGGMPDEVVAGVRLLLEHGADPTMAMVDEVPLLERVLSAGGEGLAPELVGWWRDVGLDVVMSGGAGVLSEMVGVPGVGLLRE